MGSPPEKRERSTTARSEQVSSWRSEILLSPLEAPNQPARRVATTLGEQRLCKCRTMYKVVFASQQTPARLRWLALAPEPTVRLIGDGRVFVREVGDIPRAGQDDSRRFWWRRAIGVIPLSFRPIAVASESGPDPWGRPYFSTGRRTRSSPQCGGRDAQANAAPGLGGYFCPGRGG
jgi:hypothetical protein